MSDSSESSSDSESDCSGNQVSAGIPRKRCNYCKDFIPIRSLTKHENKCFEKKTIADKVALMSELRKDAHNAADRRNGHHLVFIPKMSDVVASEDYRHQMMSNALYDVDDVGDSFNVGDNQCPSISNSFDISPSLDDDSFRSHHSSDHSLDHDSHAGDHEPEESGSEHSLSSTESDLLRVATLRCPSDPSETVKSIKDDIVSKPDLPESILPCSEVRACIDLLRVLKLHRIGNLKLFDDIMSWAGHHSQKYHPDNYDVFASDVFYKFSKRKTLVRELITLYGVSNLKPSIKVFRLTSRPAHITVPVFDFQAMFEDLIDDETLMRPENFSSCINHMNGKFESTGTSTRNNSTPAEFNSGSRHMLEDMASGYMYDRACKLHATGTDDYAAGLVFFIDKSHSDAFGALASSPVIFTMASFNTNTMRKRSSWRILGYIPNLGVGKGKNDTTKTTKKMQDEHSCLSIVLKSLKDLARKTYTAKIFGAERNVKFWIHCVIGDTSGNNVLCGHYNSSWSTFPYRDCLCTLHEMSRPSQDGCTYLKWSDITLFSSKNSSHLICKHPIKNAFSDLPLSDVDHGILGITPPECLHVFGVGIYKYAIEAIHDIIGENDSYKKEKESMDILFQHVAKVHGRQSDRDYPRWSNRFGINDKTRLTGTERRGNIFILIMVLHTSKGRDIMSKRCSQQKTKGITVGGIISVLSSLLSFEAWLKEGKEYQEVCNAEPAVQSLVENLRRKLPRRVKNQWNLPKIHTLFKFLRYMRAFGSAATFDSSTGEGNHIPFFKTLAQHTQRRYSSFACQVADRLFENMVVDRASSSIHEYCCQIKRHEYTNSDDALIEDDEPREIKTTVQCTLKFRPQHNRPNEYYIHSSKWESKDRQNLKIDLDRSVGVSIASQLSRFKGALSLKRFEVTCFTTAKLNGVLYCASPYY